MSALSQRLEQHAQDMEYTTPEGVTGSAIGVPIEVVVAEVNAAHAAALKDAANFIAADARKWRPVKPDVADILQAEADDLRKYARRIGRGA